MSNIYLYNKTKYSDSVLQSVLETAYKQVNIRGKKLQGDVAVKVMYSANSCGFIGQMWNSKPRLSEIVGSVKKYGKGFKVQDRYSTYVSATPDGSVGWIIIRLPKSAAAVWGQMEPKVVYETILHELIHVWQYRNKDDALADWNRPGTTWGMFWRGYTSPAHRTKLPYIRKPLEVHVRDKVSEIPQTKGRQVAEMELSKLFNLTVSKKKQTVKYNKYGQRMSDYRNVKMNKLRNGDEIVVCPHCGEKSVILDQHKYDENPTYTHISAIDDEAVRFSGFTPSECRYTQFGHTTDKEGRLLEVKFGFETIPCGDDDHLKSFSYNIYGRR